MDFQGIFNAIIGVLVIAIPAYFGWRAKRAESKGAIAAREHEVIKANTSLQIELTNAAKGLIVPLENAVKRLQKKVDAQDGVIEKQGNRIKLQSQEIEAVRQVSKEQTELIARIRSDHEKRIEGIVAEYTNKIKKLEAKYEKKINELKVEAVRARNSEKQLLDKIDRIKESLDVDTGKLETLVKDKGK